MPIPRKIINFLEKAKVKYEPIEHRIVYTAYDKAQTLKVPESSIGKTLVLKIDEMYSLVLIGADKILDKAKFKKIFNLWCKEFKQKPIKNIKFASETWMKKNLKGVKVGAIPPFGNLWTPTRPPSRKRAPLPTFLDKFLLKSRYIIVSAGDYSFSIKISPSIFKKLIPNLILGNFGKRK